MEESENEIDDEATDNDSTDANIQKKCRSNPKKSLSITRSENFSRQNGDVEGHAEPFYVEKNGFKPKSSTHHGETVEREQKTPSAESKTELIQNTEADSTSKSLSIPSAKITTTDNKTGARPKTNLKEKRRKSKQKGKRPNEQDIIQVHPNEAEEMTNSTPSCLGDKKLSCTPKSETDIQSKLLPTPISRLRCHDNDLEGQENEIVVFSDCTMDLDNAALLKLIQLYINDERYEEVKSNINEVVSRLDCEFYSMKPSADENTNHVQPTSQSHEAEMARQYKQCAVFLQKCPGSVLDALRCLYKGLICAGNPRDYGHNAICKQIWKCLLQDLINSNFQSTSQALEELIMICHDFFESRTNIILFMAFEVASHLVTCVTNTALPEQSRRHIITILQQSWLICTRCHVRLKEYKKALEVVKFLCRDPRQCTNSETLQLHALCLFHTGNYALAQQKVDLGLKVSTSEEQRSQLKKLQEHLKQKNLQDGIDSAPEKFSDNSKETDTGYSYGEQINLLESATFDLLLVQDLSDDWSDTQSIAESVYSTFSDASTLDSLSTSKFSKRTRKRKVRNKTKTIRQKKLPAKEQSSNLTALNTAQTSKFEDIEKWRRESHIGTRNQRKRKNTNRDNNEEILYLRDETRNDCMSDTSSVTSHMTKSKGDLSADDFSDSDYDLADSGSDWCGSTSDIDIDGNCSEKYFHEEPTYYAKSSQYHKGRFSARNILENEYFQKGLDLSDDCIENVGHNYFKGNRIIYSNISKIKFDDQCQILPKIYKKCVISIKSAHQAVCTPVEPNDEIQEIEIAGRSKCGQTFSDDIVVVKIYTNRHNQENGKIYGEVVSLVERHRYRDIEHPVFVCLLDLKDGHLMKPLCRTVPKLHILHSKVQRNHKHLLKSRVEIYRYDAPRGELDFIRYHDVKEGEREQWLFIVAYIKWKPNKIYPLAVVIDVIHCSQNPYDGIRIMSKEHQVPYFYAKTTVEGIETTMKEVKSFNIDGYNNRTENLTVFTIDPPGSKDLDDALSITMHKDGTYTVGVHITDVTSIVKKDDPIDQEARERCVTFYPGKGFRPFAMLPEPLCEVVLSLLPNQKRPVISVFIKFDKDGKLSTQVPEVQKSIVKSCRQLTYQEAQDILDDKMTDESEELIQDVKMLSRLSELLKIARIGHAAFSFPVEIDISEEENFAETYQAHSLVEEFMILANHSIAKILRRHFPGCIPLLCQQSPPKEVITNWYNVNKHYIHHIMGLQGKNITTEIEISLDKSSHEGRNRKLTPIQSWIFEEIKNLAPGMNQKQNLSKIKQLILSDYLHPKQALAYHEWNMLQESSKYICSTDIIRNPERGGHFCLGKNSYVHFTSPIRRYCDIIIHRLVTAMLDGVPSPYQPDDIARMCITMNDATRRAHQFQKNCKQFILARYLKENPILFNGFVKEISDSGVKVVIPGLQRISSASKEVKFNLLDVGCKPELKDDVDMLSMTPFEKDRKMVVVKWEKRLYSFKNKACQKPKPTRSRQDRGTFSPFLRIYPHQNTTFLRYKDQWTKILTLIFTEEHDKLRDILLRFVDDEQTRLNIYHDTETVSSHNRSVKDVSSEVRKGIIVEHRCKFQVPFHHGQVVQVQMSAHINRGFLEPIPQIFSITDNVKFCIDHYENPVKILLRYAKLFTKTSYSNVEEYIRIWIPIVEMESVVSAVRSEESAVINDIPVEFRGRRGRFALTKGFCDIRDLDVSSGNIEQMSSSVTEQTENTDKMSTVFTEKGDNTDNVFTGKNVSPVITERGDNVATVTTKRGDNTGGKSSVITERGDNSDTVATVITESVNITDNVSTVITERGDNSDVVSTLMTERGDNTGNKSSKITEEGDNTNHVLTEIKLEQNTAKKEDISDDEHANENKLSETEQGGNVVENSKGSQNGSFNEKKLKYTEILSSHFLCIKLKRPLSDNVKAKIGQCLPKDSNYIWVAHGEFIKSRKLKTKKYSERRGGDKKVLEIDLVFKLHESSPSPPVREVKSEDKCSIELILKPPVFRRIECYIKSLGQASELAIDIALGRRIRKCDQDHIRLCGKMSCEVDIPGIPRNNTQQHQAIKKALNSRFSLIQGPPGTGKTFTGVKLVYLFNQFNKLCQEEDGKQRKIIFCGPSNKSVDLVARWVIKKLGDKAPRLVRMYASAYEYLDFPVPGRAIISSRSMRNAQSDSDLKDNGVVLHHVIRERGKPHADELRSFDKKFESDNVIIKENEKVPHEQRKPINTKLDDIYEYKALLYQATFEELDKYDVIFCTTSLAANIKLLKATKDQVSQVIIDECGMCSEPESMLPIIATHANQVVLIGDHKQLRPIILCREASDLGLGTSLFERYSTKQDLMTMLQEQYRMLHRGSQFYWWKKPDDPENVRKECYSPGPNSIHASICDFPSKAFYDSKLKTAPGIGTSHKPLRMWPRTNDEYGHIPRVFCHIEGEEETLTVKTKEGNEQSRSNKREIEQVLKVFKHMVTVEGVDPQSINVMSQYLAQCTALRNELTERGYENLHVSTVVSSQGGEWDYVIFSLVRSLPKYLIEKDATEGWCIQNLGFITDKHQINVALTRAKKGLVIIGNKNLLECDQVWKKLLEDYQQKKCIFEARNFPP